jgi:hypothetical protein
MKLTKYTFLIIISTILSFTQKKDLDQRLVGKWANLHAKDQDGEIIKDEFYGKKYIDTFLKNGQYLIDPNFLRDDMKRNGIKEPLDYSLIPALSWTTYENQTLEIASSEGSQKIRYNFLGDTLILGYQNGNTRYLLKSK